MWMSLIFLMQFFKAHERLHRLHTTKSTWRGGRKGHRARKNEKPQTIQGTSEQINIQQEEAKGLNTVKHETVVNISSVQQSDDEMQLLTKGLSFYPCNCTDWFHLEL